MTDLTTKLLVIGGGPGGYVCAIRAGQLGIDTILVEKSQIGGTCLNIGCIPSKALIHVADEFASIAARAGGQGHGIRVAAPAIDLADTMAWKDRIVARLTDGVSALLKKARVHVIQGQARFLDGKTVEIVGRDQGRQIVRAETIVIATGSETVELPGLPFGGTVLSSTEALSLTEIPKQLAIVGGGYIGLEIGTALAKLGSLVTIIEAGPSILPSYDEELTRPVATRLAKLGVTIRTRSRARSLSADGTGLDIEADDGRVERIAADKILVTVGRRPVLSGFGLEDLGLERSGPFLKIDDRCRTSMRGIHAIGDVTGEPMLAHRAMAQGEMVAENVAGRKRAWDKVAIPSICFTDPEIVSVGMAPAEAERTGISVRTGRFPLRANGRTMTLGRDDGFVRVTARADSHLVIGIQAVGAGIAELAAGFSLALEMGARLEDIAATIHAHPSQGEALQEACLAGLGQALHL